MRIWTLHPQYLDPTGLVALWREALLAQKVLLGETRGYRSHPQLTRFREHPEPVRALGSYLHDVHREALRRGYRFDAGRIHTPGACEPRLTVTEGQLRYEWEHLLRKLESRHPALYAELGHLDAPEPHPLFGLTTGPVAAWERVQAQPARS